MSAMRQQCDAGDKECMVGTTLALARVAKSRAHALATRAFSSCYRATRGNEREGGCFRRQEDRRSQTLFEMRQRKMCPRVIAVGGSVHWIEFTNLPANSGKLPSSTHTRGLLLTLARLPRHHRRTGHSKYRISGPRRPSQVPLESGPPRRPLDTRGRRETHRPSTKTPLNEASTPPHRSITQAHYIQDEDIIQICVASSARGQPA